MDVPLSELEYNEEGESLTMLHQTEWVRIILVRSTETPGFVIVEVEVSLPSSAYETCPGTLDDSSRIDMENVLSNAIAHLNYLMGLHNNGFTLDVIDQNCLWTASQKIDSEPNGTLFDTLVPP